MSVLIHGGVRCLSLWSCLALLGACTHLPDVGPFVQSTAEVRSAVISAGTVAVEELKYMPDGATYAEKLSAQWPSRVRAMDGLVDYADALQSIVAAGGQGATTVGVLADSVGQLAAAAGIVFPAAGTAAVATDAAKFVYAQIALVRAARALEKAMEQSQPAVGQIARTIARDLDDLSAVFQAANAGILLALQEEHNRGLGFRQGLVDERNILYAKGVGAFTAQEHTRLKQTRIVQVDIEAQEIGRNYPVAVGIVGDAKAVAQQLLQCLRQTYPAGRPNPTWRADIETLAARRRDRLQAESTLSGEPMMPQRVYPELRRALPRDCMVTIDAGITPGLAYDRLHFEVPRTMFNYAGHGGLGMGLCVGLGTKLGRPDRPAVSLQGDGGFLYTSQELNTAVRWGIPLVSIVLNNGCHGAEKAQQQRFYDGRYIGVDLVNPRFDKLAEVYGARGFYVSRPDEIADAVVEALAVDGPSVIEIPVAEYFPPSAPTPASASRH